jgi:hypothetical protein
MSRITEFAKQTVNEAREIYRECRLANRTLPQLNQFQKSLLQSLESTGLAVIPDFLSHEQCAQLRLEIDQSLQKFEKYVQISPDGADNRLFGFENCSKLANEMGFSRFALDVIANYERSPEFSGTLLGAKLNAVKDNIGSGQGWHRDSAPYKQTKLIIYLSAVTETSGPFEYLPGSHTRSSVLSAVINSKFKCNQYRFSDSEIQQFMIDSAISSSKITAVEGTALLVDTRGLHRGSPIIEGTRYAMTSYLWFGRDMPPHIASKAVPAPGLAT